MVRLVRFEVEENCIRDIDGKEIAEPDGDLRPRQNSRKKS